jgi:uncharacterized membrane protein
MSTVKRRWPLILFLVFYLLFAVYSHKDYGITFDEWDVYWRGKLFYTKIKGNDPVLQKDFVIKQKNGNKDLLYSSSVYPAVLYIFNGQENFERYHLLNLMFAVLIFIAAYELLLSVFEKPYLAILGPIFLVFTPRFFGDLPANPKDMPFAVMYFLSLTAVYFSAKWEEKNRLILLGFVFGLTASLRFVGYSLFAVNFFYSVFYVKDKKILDVVKENFIIFLIGFLTNIFFLPHLGADPFNNLKNLIVRNNRFPWIGNLLFLGKEYNLGKGGSPLPWFYLPVWVGVTTPVSIMALFLAVFFQKKKNKLIDLFFTSIFINLFIYFLARPTVYNGLRHTLFLLPQMAFVAAVSFLSLNGQFKKIAALFVIADFILISIAYISLHPYEYVYFNSLIGGLSKASSLMETDYWSASNREAVRWLDGYLAENKKNKANIFVCGDNFSATYYFSGRMALTQDKNRADYLICYKDSYLNGQIKKPVLHTVKREGAVLNYIYGQ